MIYKNIFFSKEPGYYEDEQFGIRLENIFMVKEVETTVNIIKVLLISKHIYKKSILLWFYYFLQYKFPNTTFLGFETVTLVPYEPSLINYDLLSQSQVKCN